MPARRTSLRTVVTLIGVLLVCASFASALDATPQSKQRALEEFLEEAYSRAKWKEERQSSSTGKGRAQAGGAADAVLEGRKLRDIKCPGVGQCELQWDSGKV
jgi:prophage antirepressor-like protein